MPTVAANGIDLYFESHGHGPAILFAHGAGGNHLSWWQQVPAFCEEYQCVTFDHRAFGRSLDTSGQGRASFSADLIALMDHLGIERAFMVAQSMGGRTAAGLVRTAPGRLRALVLAGTTGGAVDDTIRARQKEFAASQPEGQTLLDRALDEQTRRERPDLAFLYQAIARLNPPRPRDFLAPRPGYLGSTATLFANSGIPMLFLVGEHDRIVPPSIAQAAHRLVRGSRFAMIAGAGHSSYFEQAEHFNETVRRFLREAEQGMNAVETRAHHAGASDASETPVGWRGLLY